jgi:hypothetical protein
MRGRERIDVVSLVAGVAIIVIGIAVLLDRTGALDMGFAAIPPNTLAVIGAILLASGLTRSG